MKILFINNFKNVDYLNDGVFHGARSLFGSDCVDSTFAWYMYRQQIEDYIKYQNRQLEAPLYGMGYNIAGKLDDMEIDRSDIPEKIKDKYFDLIVYGSVHRCMDYWDIVQHVYEPNKVIFIDGEDQTYTKKELLGKGIYFKREIDEYTIGEVIPISFAIPSCQMVPDTPYQKTKLVADSTYYAIGYKFSMGMEQEYNEEYKKSYFGLTKKKAGWDCYRHYEIIANGSLPVFYKLHECPPRTMLLWDKQLLNETTDLFWNFRMNNNQDNGYFEMRSRCLTMLKEKLTTEAIFNYILSQV
jgi:hypothetical protein